MSAFAEQHIATDTGRVRTQNEDAVWMNDRILAVADGMGGHSRGEVASRIAIETVTEYADVLTNSSADPDEMREAVDAVFQLASERIEAEAAGAQMGTTLVFAVLAPNGSTVYIAHAGDSRAYLKRRGLLRTLTRDHNVYNLLIERGMDEQEAANHPHREKLTQGLGFGFVEPDLAVVELTGDDTVLRTSALMDERVGQDWSPRVKSPIGWDSVVFVPGDHLQITAHPVALNNILYLLLEQPRPDAA